MIIANMLQNIAAGYVLFLLGRINVETLAAYSIVMTSVMALYYSVHGSLINAAIALVSRKCGEVRQAEVGRSLPGMLVFGTAVFLAYGAIVFFTLGPVLSFFGAKGAVLEMSGQYMKIALIACFFMTFYSLLLGVARGAGDSMTPLKVVMLMTGVNIILNTVLTLHFKWGIKGAAYSEMLSYGVAAAAYIAVFARGLHGIKLGGIKPEPGLLKTYASLTGKSMLQNFSLDFSMMLMLRIVSGYGNAFIAAYGIVTRLNGFLMMIGWPITNSGGIVVGQNLGRKMRDRAMQTIKDSFAVFSWIMVPASVVYLAFPGLLTAVFTTDPQVIKYGSMFLMIIAPAMIFLAAGQAAQSGLSGAGYMTMPTLANIATLIIIRVALAATLPSFEHLKQNGVFIAISVSLILYGIVNWYLYRKGKWTQKEI